MRVSAEDGCESVDVSADVDFDYVVFEEFLGCEGVGAVGGSLLGRKQEGREGRRGETYERGE